MSCLEMRDCKRRRALYGFWTFCFLRIQILFTFLTVTVSHDFMTGNGGKKLLSPTGSQTHHVPAPQSSNACQFKLQMRMSTAGMILNSWRSCQQKVWVIFDKWDGPSHDAPAMSDRRQTQCAASRWARILPHAGMRRIGWQDMATKHPSLV